jgi:hypothetical protein
MGLHCESDFSNGGAVNMLFPDELLNGGWFEARRWSAGGSFPDFEGVDVVLEGVDSAVVVG